ncbi:hypothetical protein [Pseudalkalibacillus sp. SCS-8]
MSFPFYGGFSLAWPIVGLSLLFALVIIIFTWAIVFKSFKLFF